MTEQVTGRRWSYLEDNRALTDAGWLPPAEDCPALADLREAHERVLAASAEAGKAASAISRRREAELEAVRAAEEEALFTGKEVKLPEVTVMEAEIDEARMKAQAARDALQRFVRQAVEQVLEREGQIVSAIEETALEAINKRVEAQRLLDEADALERTPKRLRLWLDRFTGASVLGHYPYAQIAAPPKPQPLDMEAALAGGDITEVEVLG